MAGSQLKIWPKLHAIGNLQASKLNFGTEQSTGSSSSFLPFAGPHWWFPGKFRQRHGFFKFPYFQGKFGFRPGAAPTDAEKVSAVSAIDNRKHCTVLN